jgi:zinc protease
MRTTSAWVFVAYVTSGLNSADFPALRVMSAALTQSSKARLPQRLFALNNKRSTSGDYDTSTFQIAGQVTPRRFAGDLVLFAQTGPQNVESTKNIMLDEVRKLGEKPLTPVELSSAKIFARGSWAVEREGLRDRAFQAALASALNAPADPTWPSRIAAVTAADVQRVARKYLGHYVVALIMPEE